MEKTEKARLTLMGARPGFLRAGNFGNTITDDAADPTRTHPWTAEDKFAFCWVFTHCESHCVSSVASSSLLFVSISLHWVWNCIKTSCMHSFCCLHDTVQMFSEFRWRTSTVAWCQSSCWGHLCSLWAASVSNPDTTRCHPFYWFTFHQRRSK